MGQYSSETITGVNLDTLLGALRYGAKGPGLQHKLGVSGCAALAAALERARVVGVLDGWAAQFGHLVSIRQSEVSWVVSLEVPRRQRGYFGATPDEARAKAAAAIEAGEV